MFFFSKQMIIFWLLAFHTADGEITLTTNHHSINSLATKNFILKCSFEFEHTRVLSVQLKKVIKTGTGFKNLVIMDVNSKIHILSPSPDVKYTGGIQEGNSKAYLSGTWHRVPKGLGGTYKCEVEIAGSSVSFERDVNVLEEKTTFAHSVAAIEDLQTSDVQSWAAIKELQRFMHKMQTWKESMVWAFNILERATRKKLHSKIYRNKYYIVYKRVPRNVKFAEDYCQARGGYLAELNDWNEWNFVASFSRTIIRKTFLSGFYVSGRRNLADDTFYWPRIGNGKPAYFKWHIGKPNNYRGNQNCVEIGHMGQGARKRWGISDTVCDSRYKGFVCEMPKLQ